ncbi:MAG: hypothetical protein Q9206_006977, partial [Seirophora lacunosa]
MHFVLTTIFALLALLPLALPAPIAGPKSFTVADYVSSLHHYATASVFAGVGAPPHHLPNDSRPPSPPAPTSIASAEDAHVGAPEW